VVQPDSVHPTAPQPGVFDVSLALTGTVSAGAYTAGVLDFLQLALDAWEEARTRGADVPRHRVLLRGIAGTSGGAVSAVTFAAGLAKVPGAPSPLYRLWVEGLDFQKLLRVPERAEPALTSFLDSDAVDEVARGVHAGLGAERGAAWRPWASDPFTLRLTMGNITGVPYWFPMDGAAGTRDGFTMVLHGDYAGYGISPAGAAPLPGDAALPALGAPGGTLAAWSVPIDSSVASAAVPFALRSRLQTFPVALRNARPFLSPLSPDTFVAVPPAWPTGQGDTYRSWNVDGASVDNEPIDVARQILAGPGGRNARAPGIAQRLMVMVAPTVQEGGWTPQPVETVGQQVSVGVPALLALPRFKAADLVLATQPTVASRWVIAPRLPAGGAFLPPTPIVSGGLGAFAGFLHPAFRQHDYALGRHNCQQFLARSFKLPASNPGFGGAGGEGDQPVIPLVGRALEPVAPPPWIAPGTFTPQDWAALEAQLGARLDYVKDRAVASCAPGALARAALWGLWRGWGRERLRGALLRPVAAFLKAYGV